MALTNNAGSTGKVGRRLFLQGTVGVLILTVLGLVFWLRSASFQRWAKVVVSRRIAAETGLRVEIGTFHLGFHPFLLSLGTVLAHGREPAGSPPLARIPRITVWLKWRSLFGGLRASRVEIDRPQIALFRLADGGLNLPLPSPVFRTSGSAFVLGIQRMDVEQGTVNWNGELIPLRARLADLGLNLAYVGGRRPHYRGRLQYGSGRLAAGSVPPLAQSAALRFRLWPDRLQVRLLRLSAEGLHLEARGWVRNLSAPAISGLYSAQIAAPWLAGRVSVAGIRSGTIDLGGQAEWSKTGWQLKAKFGAHGIGFQSPWSALGSWSAAGTLQARPGLVALSALHLHGLGGRVALAGQGHAGQWQLAGDFSGLDTTPLLRAIEALGRAQRPAKFPSARGVASGNLRIQGPLTRALQVDLQATIHSPMKSAAPIGGALHLRAQPFRRRLHIDRLRLQVGATVVRAAGDLTPRTSQLRFSLAHLNLRWLPLGGNRLRGQADVRGEVQGPWRQWTLRAQVRAAAVECRGVGPHPPGPAFHWAADQAAAQFVLSPNRLRLQAFTARAGSQRLLAHGEVALSGYRLRPRNAVRMAVLARGWRAAPIEMAVRDWDRADLPFAVHGRVNASFAIAGAWRAPTVQGQLALEAGAIAGRWGVQPLRMTTARFRWANRQLIVPAFAVRLIHSSLQGSGAYDAGTGRYRIDLSSPGVDLLDLPILQSPRLPLTGQVAFQVHSFGTVAQPQGMLVLSSRGLSGDGEPLGTLQARLSAAGAWAQVAMSDQLPRGQLSVNGQVSLSPSFPVQLLVTVRHYVADAWLRRFTPLRLTGHSRLSGQVRITGPLFQPAQLAASGELDPIRIEAGGLWIHNVGPVRFQVRDRLLRLSSANIAAQHMHLQLSGSAELRRGGALHGSIAGRMNLALVHRFWPQSRAHGRLQIQAKAEGPWAHPRLFGVAAVSGATWVQAGLPFAFDDLNGRWQFGGDRIDIQSLTAHAGGGTLAISGYATRSSGGLRFELAGQAENVRLREEGLRLTANARLRLAGGDSQALLRGDLELTHVAPTPHFDLAVIIADLRTAPTLPNPNSVLSHIHLDIHARTGPGVELSTGAGRLQVQADLQVNGTAAQPILLGRASVPEGKLLFAGTRYTIGKGEVTFANPFRLDPLLDFALNTTIQDYDITIEISGPADKLNVSYRSDPPLSSSEIVSLLATGETKQPSSQALSEAAANSFVGPSEELLNVALNNIISNRMERIFGITQIRLNPNLGGASNLGNGGVTIVEQVSPHLELSYTENLTSNAQDVVRIHWTVNRHVGLVLSRDPFGVYGVSFRFRHRAR